MQYLKYKSSFEEMIKMFGYKKKDLQITKITQQLKI
jgi:hypothetical protein